MKHLNACTGIVSSFQRPRAMEAQVAGLTGLASQVLPSQRCAGAEYPLVASGVRDFALYWRTLVWDHAPGMLNLEEAGGTAARLDGALTAASSGIPATSVFCMSSKLALPETIKPSSVAGK